MAKLKLTSHMTKRLTSPPVACATYFTFICTHDYATTDRNEKDGPAPERVQQQTSIQPGQEMAPTSGTAATAPSVHASTTDAIPDRNPLGAGQGPPRTADQGQAAVQALLKLDKGSNEEARGPQTKPKTKAAPTSPPSEESIGARKRHPSQGSTKAYPIAILSCKAGTHLEHHSA